MAAMKIPADLQQEVRLNRWVEANGNVHEDLRLGYTSDEEPHIYLSATKALRLGVAVAGEVTDDPDFDWRHLDVHASHEYDHEDDWDEDDEEMGEGGYPTRSFLAGEAVEVDAIYPDGTTAVVCGGSRYGAMPAGSVLVDLATIKDPAMREIARQMLAGIYTVPPVTPEEIKRAQ